MSEILLVTILPAFIVFTSYVFNIAIKEIIDFKYGLNKHQFKPIAVIAFTLYCICSLSSLDSTSAKSGVVLKNNMNAIIIVTQCVVYYIMFYEFNRYKSKILFGKAQYRPSNKTFILFLFLSGGLIGLSSFLTFFCFSDQIEIVIKMLSSESQQKDSFALVSIFLYLFINYTITMLTAGYLYSYGILFNFRRYKMIFTKEFECILDKLEIETHGNIIDVYVLVDSEESMMIKVADKEIPAITIKKEHIINLMFVVEGDKSQKDETSLRKHWFTKLSIKNNNIRK